MAHIYASAEAVIGNTPLVRLSRLEKEWNLDCTLLVKVEALNPAGSAKDRVGLHMIDVAEKEGKLVPGSCIIEPTSGNTGIGLAMVGAIRGYRTVIVMPDSMSRERQLLMTAYGAELVLTPGKLGMKGAIEKAEELAKEIPHSFIPDQFNNPANSEAHYLTTGPEIVRDTDGLVDFFLCGIGTGGTVTGTGRYLKENIPNVQVIGVEPSGSPVLSGGKAGPHGLQGIGAGFVPGTLDTTVYDEILTCTEEEAYAAGRLLAKHEGILAGISGGAALASAKKVMERPRNKGKTIVVLLPDTGDRYLSTPLYAN